MKKALGSLKLFKIIGVVMLLFLYLLNKKKQITTAATNAINATP